MVTAGEHRDAGPDEGAALDDAPAPPSRGSAPAGDGRRSPRCGWVSTSTRSARVTCVLERDALGEVEEALVAEEALARRSSSPRQPAPIEVEEAHVVEDRAAADPGARAGAARERASGGKRAKR